MRLQSGSHTSSSGETVQEEEASNAATRSDKMDIVEAVDDKTEETEDEEKAAPRIISGSSARIGPKFWNMSLERQHKWEVQAREIRREFDSFARGCRKSSAPYVKETPFQSHNTVAE